jgi:Sec-independent protein translocase protein TatA
MVVVAEEAVVVSVVVVVVVATTAVLVVTGTAELAAGRLEDAITEMQQQTSSIQSTAAARESSKNLTTHHESQKQSDDFKTHRETDRGEMQALADCSRQSMPNKVQRRMQISFLPQQRAVIMMPLLECRAETHALREEAQTTVLEHLVVLVLLAWVLLALSVCSGRFTNPI